MSTGHSLNIDHWSILDHLTTGQIATGQTAGRTATRSLGGRPHRPSRMWGHSTTGQASTAGQAYPAGQTPARWSNINAGQTPAAGQASTAGQAYPAGQTPARWSNINAGQTPTAGQASTAGQAYPAGQTPARLSNINAGQTPARWSSIAAGKACAGLPACALLGGQAITWTLGTDHWSKIDL